LTEIASTGAPGIVTALGMGTVFLCLVLLYLITRIIGSSLARLLAPAGGADPTLPVSSRTEHEGAATTETDPAAASREEKNGEEGMGKEGVIAAMTLALVRHRSARMKPAVGEPTGADLWKIAGRIRTLRDS
jgi:Na+-transporting methylmalonyl-CoA/oxaloacetate decarboxylase gamma subunit